MSRSTVLPRLSDLLIDASYGFGRWLERRQADRSVRHQPLRSLCRQYRELAEKLDGDEPVSRHRQFLYTASRAELMRRNGGKLPTGELLQSIAPPEPPPDANPAEVASEVRRTRFNGK